jgi:hypothetical protein
MDVVYDEVWALGEEHFLLRPGGVQENMSTHYGG